MLHAVARFPSWGGAGIRIAPPRTRRTVQRYTLAAADELAAGTIDTVLATSDLELGLEALFGRRRRPHA